MRGAIVLVRRPHVIFAASALVLAGCSSSGGLTTASLMGGGNASEASASAAAPAGPPPSDPTSRTLQVAATSARATRCGFYFDPEKLKSSFLAAEMAQGASPEELQKIEREYNYVRSSVAEKIAEDSRYCDDARTKEIKRDLNRHLAGDFTPAPKKQEAQQGLLAGLLDSDPAENKPFNADTFFEDLSRRNDR